MSRSYRIRVRENMSRVLRAAVVQDAAASEDQQIDAPELLGHLSPGERSRRNRALDAMTCQGIGRSSGEHGDLGGHACAQLAQDAFQDRFVAEIHAAVGP